MHEEIEKTEREIATLQEKLQKLKSENGLSENDIKTIVEQL